jgi:hypothetical protein
MDFTTSTTTTKVKFREEEEYDQVIPKPGLIFSVVDRGSYSYIITDVIMKKKTKSMEYGLPASFIARPLAFRVTSKPGEYLQQEYTVEWNDVAHTSGRARVKAGSGDSSVFTFEPRYGDFYKEQNSEIEWGKAKYYSRYYD